MIPNYGIRDVSLLLALVLSLSACGHTAEAGAYIDRALEKYIPPDSIAVGQINLKALRSTAFFQQHQAEFGAFVAPGDVDHALGAWDGKNVIVAESVSDGKEPKLLGEPGLVAKLRNGSGKLPNELTPAIDSVPAAAQIWAVVQGLPINQLHLPSEYASLLENFRGHIRRTAVGLTVQTGLNLHARIECFSEQGSQRVDVALRAGIGLARITSMQKDPLEARAYEALDVRREGTSVYVEGAFPPDVSDYLLRHLSSAARP